MIAKRTFRKKMGARLQSVLNKTGGFAMQRFDRTLRVTGMAAFLVTIGFAFLPSPGRAADFSPWMKTMQLTFSGYNPPGGGTLTNFPALVILSNNIQNSGFAYSDVSFTNAADLRFSAADGTTELAYEIDQWNTNGASYVWVQVPTLASTNDSVWVYWKNAAASNAPSYTTNGTTWTNGYLGVWHFSGAPTSGGSFPDSTAAGNHGTYYTDGGSSNAAPGPIGPALYLDGSGQGKDYVKVPSNVSNTSNFTFMGWINWPGVALWQRVFDFGNDQNNWLFLTPKSDVYAPYSAGNRMHFHTLKSNAQRNAIDGSAQVPSNQWSHVVVTINGNDGWMYCNGVLFGSTIGGITNHPDVLGGASNYFGRSHYVENDFKGYLDEFSVASVGRASNWIWAAYVNQASNGVFWSYGTAGAGGRPAINNRAATNVTTTSAFLNGYLATTGNAPATVSVYWGDTDGGAPTSGLWKATNTWAEGAWTNGTYPSYAVTGLVADTVYYYRFGATNLNGAGWASSSESFVTRSAGFNAWMKTMQITFSGYNPPGGGTLTNFPALVIFSNNIANSGFDYSSFSFTNASDLRFSAADGTTELAYEIDQWNTNGVSYVWVQVPTLASTNDCVWAYWKNAAASNAPACTTNGAVWTNGYRGVWHMNQTNALDSTTNRNHGTSFGNVATNTMIGTAQRFYPDNIVIASTWDYITIPDSPSLQNVQEANYTLEGWFQPRVNPPGSGSADNAGYCIVMKEGWHEGLYEYTTNFSMTVFTNNAVSLSAEKGPIPAGVPYYVVGAADRSGGNVRLYVNGTVTTTAFAPVAGYYEFGTKPWRIGSVRTGASNYSWPADGIIDEIRISAVARASNWVWACYMNMASNATFNHYGVAGGLPVVANQPAADVTLTSATFGGTLVSTGSSPASVSVYWGTHDGDNVATAWGHTNAFADYQAVGSLTTNLTGLSSNTTYFYRFCAMNSSGTNWASPSSMFVAGEVSLQATTPNASEVGPASGAFTVSRPATATNGDLSVAYTVGGSAGNGGDYATLSGTVTISNGQSTATIVVAPTWDQTVEETETVQVTLAAGPYVVGTQSNGIVTIADAPVQRVWSGTGNWNDTNYWAGGIAPAAGEGALIAGGSITLTNATPSLGYLYMTNGTLTFSSTNAVLMATDIIVSGTVTHAANSATTTNQSGEWVANGRVTIVCTNLTIASAGKIDVTGKGYGGGVTYTNGYGPGGGLYISPGVGAGGGGYGGRGGFLGSRGTQAAANGSVALPTQPGSGGGADGGYAGGAGGGSVWLTVAGIATVSGQIIADGAAGGEKSGAGSGGGVYLSAPTLRGGGSITAKGGDGNAQYGSGGGGGRIALWAGDATGWTGRIDVGLGWTHTLAPQAPAQAGTVYATNSSLLRDSFTNQQWRLYGVTGWTPGQLTVSNAYLSFEESTFNLAVSSDAVVAGGSYLGFGSGLVTNSASFSVGGNLSILGSNTLFLSAASMTPAASLTVGGNMTLSNGVLYVASAPTNGTTDYGALVSVTGDVYVGSASTVYPVSDPTNGGSVLFRAANVTVATGGRFMADNAGFAGATAGSVKGYGPGGSTNGSNTGGAGYGGAGGSGGGGSYTPGGPAYGDPIAPVWPGSGAGTVNGSRRPAGGGLVRIDATGGRFTLNGALSANGQGITDDRDGGGSGGGIFLKCRTFDGNGSMTANGGNGGNWGGGGGGAGRIAIWYLYSNYTGVAVSTGGVKGASAAAPAANGANNAVVWNRLSTPPVITNNAATNVSYFSAFVNATLVSTGTAPTYVSVFWGTTDGGTNKQDWSHTNDFPNPQAEGAVLSTNIAGLDSGVSYTYRYYASNSAGEAWADQPRSFTTIAGVPVISNAAGGATAVTLTSATLNGDLVSIGTAATSLKVFWGPADGGTNWGGWANTNSFAGTQTPGLWSTNVSLGASNIYYYYTFYATNSGGAVWASPSMPFIAAGVTLTATDPSAAEKGANNTGTFTVSRPAAVTNLPLTVNYTVGGTAANGVDYALLSGSVIIPAGATTNTITISPIMDAVSENLDEQVTLTLAPGAYAIGSPSSDTVTIQDMLPAATNIWTGTGNWTNAANWSDAMAPLSGQAILIQGAVTLATNSAALGPVVIFTNGTLTFNSTNAVLTATDVMLSGTVTHAANSATTTNQSGEWVADGRVTIVCTNLTIAAGGKIDATGKGYGGGVTYTNGRGPGGGRYVNPGVGAGGGGYGGRGGFLGSRGPQAAANGSVTLPTQPGSGGGADNGYAGGAGGGSVWLTVASTTTISGQIVANGVSGGQSSGAGSGGGVYLSTPTLRGSGSITAKGGDGDSQYGSGGGGGRIAVWAGDATGWAGNIDVGLGWTHTLAPQAPAQLGTVYASSPSLLRESFTNQQWRLFGVTAWVPGELTVSNAYLSFEEPAFTLAVLSNMAVAGGSYLGLGAGLLTNAVSLSVTGNLSVLGASALSLGVTNMPVAATLTVGGDLMLSNGASLSVYSGPTNGSLQNYYGSLVSVGQDMLLASNAWVYPYSHSTNGGSPTFRMRDLTILTNAGFNANSAGFVGGWNAGCGPGLGSIGSDNVSGGASHGGLGGRGYRDGGYRGSVGPTNGSVLMPAGPGSGAGGYGGVVGGAGGGLVRIEAGRRVTINGTITANGQNGTNTPTAGGSGGAIYIRCTTLAGDTAVLSANGGNCGDYGSPVILAGAGGGGRIAIWCERGPASTNGWSVTVNGGAGRVGYSPVAGADGTIYWGDVSPAGSVFTMR